MSSWERVPLGSISELSWGDTSTTKASYVASGYTAYSASGPDGLLPYFDHDRDAIVISAIGAKCGKTWLARGRWSCIKNTMWMRGQQDLAKSAFLYYATRREDFWPRRGAAQPFISLGDARATQVALPDLETQARIVACLAAFDELIEINERRIELLDRIGRSLYREWFVRFRFPGHDQAEFVEVDSGRRPTAWAARRVADYFALIGGGTPSKAESDYWADGTIDWYTPSDLTRRRTRFVDDSATRITELGLAKSSARAFAAGSVLMTSRATLGVLAIATRRAGCNQGFIVIPPTPGVPPMFVCEWLADKKDELEAIATGATFKEITKGAMKRFPFVMPSSDVLEQFGAVAEPIGAVVALLERTNRQLQVTRDLLLPRLVTGRLDISDIDLGTLLAADTEAA